jgi:biopolymer transport protein ExbD
MRFKRYAEYTYGLQPITVAPLFNILFLVFIFGALCVSSLSLGSGIRVRIPAAVTSEAVQGEAVHLVVSADGLMQVNGQMITIDQLRVFLKQMSGRRQTIMIDADTGTSWQHVIRAWDAVRASGMRDCIVATHP